MRNQDSALATESPSVDELHMRIGTKYNETKWQLTTLCIAGKTPFFLDDFVLKVKLLFLKISNKIIKIQVL